MKFLGLEISSSESAPPRSERRYDKGFSDEYYTSYSANAAGRGVNPYTAMQSSAVYSCVRLISETVASLPLIVYRRLPSGGKERAADHPLYWTLQIQPNVRNTRMEFIEAICWHLLLRGNAYLRIKFARGQIELDVLNPDRIKVEISKQGMLSYTYDEDGKKIRYSRYDIVHIRGHSEDGILGKSPIDVARETVYRAMTMERYHARTYEQGTKLSGVLEAEGELDDEVAERISKSFRDAYSGPHNVGKVALLEDKVKFKPISMSLEQAEFIDGRKLTRSEIAGIFGVPPHMIGDLDRASFSNIENQSLNFLLYTIRNWLVRIEQALMRDLLVDEEERLTYFIEFLPDALLRGDTASRFAAYRQGLEGGFLTFNEVREMENRNPFEWGDATMVPMNFRPISSQDDLDAVGEDQGSGDKPGESGQDQSANQNKDSEDDQQD